MHHYYESASIAFGRTVDLLHFFTGRIRNESADYNEVRSQPTGSGDRIASARRVTWCLVHSYADGVRPIQIITLAYQH